MESKIKTGTTTQNESTLLGGKSIEKMFETFEEISTY